MTQDAGIAATGEESKLRAEIVRLNKIIQALMNRAERSTRIQGSDFNLFQTAIILEEQISHRTGELEAALHENQRINRALQSTKEQMELEIQARQRIQEALEEANRRLEDLSTTDPLTGLANRRRLEEVLKAEWLRAMRPGKPLGAAMIDIDCFKLYNDHYGHAQGDTFLQRVAAKLKESVRCTDLVARYGGEEFAVVLPETDQIAASVVAERMRASVAALKEPHHAVPSGIVTVSIGVAVIVPKAERSSDQLFGSADAALYEAKKSGRNCVRAAPEMVDSVG